MSAFHPLRTLRPRLHWTARGRTCKTFNMFWIVVAAQVSAPVAEKATSWFTPDDMPIELVKQGPGLWQVPLRVTVEPNGKVRSCEVEATGGMADLSRLTCRIVMRRAKFQPAKLEGAAAIGVYRTSIMWVVADAPWDTSKAINADIDVTVARLPATVQSPTFVKVAFAVDAEGGKSLCAADAAKELHRIENHPALVPIACDQVMKSYRATPATDGTGKPVTSVQTALVRFSKGKGN